MIDGRDPLLNVSGTASAGPAVQVGQRLQVGMFLDDRANVTSPLMLVVYDLFRSQWQKLEWRTHEMGAGFWLGPEMNNAPRAIDGSEEGMGPDDLLCSRNARPQKALVGRAQWKINQPPSLKNNERAWKDHLGHDSSATV